MKKLIAVLFVALVMFSIVAEAEQGWVIGNDINVRKSPSKDAPKFDSTLHIGDAVDIYDAKPTEDELGRKWVQITGRVGNEKFGGGWILQRYVTYKKPNFVNSICTIESNGRVAVRRTRDGELLQWLHDGDEVRVELIFEGWAWTTKGYVKAEFISIPKNISEN